VRTGHRARRRRGLKPILAVLVVAAAAVGAQAYRALAADAPQPVRGPSTADVTAALAAAPAAPKAPPGFTLAWSPDALHDGYKAFEGVEDDRGHGDPGHPHTSVQGDAYRIGMTMKVVDSAHDRQRVEVKGMVTNGKPLDLAPGSTWRLSYSMFIPSTLQATTSFTHIMQLKMPGNGSAPILTTSLRLVGGTPMIELNLFGQGVIARTPLGPLQNSWITSTVEFRVANKPNGYVAWTLTDSKGATVVNAKRTGVDTFLDDRVRPKWGIYRSLHDRTHLQDTFLLLTNMRAFKLG
jgi:hypothetical protein